MNPNCLPTMNDAPFSLDDLISRHFDEALPLAEHQRLTAALNTDFEVRLDFVEAARLHAGLDALAPALPPVKKRHVGGWVLAGAAAALMIGGVVLFWKQPRGEQARIAVENTDGVSDGKSEESKSSGLVRRVVKSPAVAQSPEPVNAHEFLERYYVDASPNGLTVPEALKLLEHSIKSANYFRRPELEQLAFFAGAPVHPSLPDPIIVTSATSPMSVMQFLNNCIACRQVIQQPGGAIHRGPFPVVAPSQSQPERFENDYQKALRRLSRMDAGEYGDARRYDNSLSGRRRETVSIELMTGPRSVLPSGFDENSGIVLSEQEYQAFVENVKKLPSVRRTGTMAISSEPLADSGNNSRRGSVYERIDANDMFRRDDSLPEWVCFLNYSNRTRLGELVCVTGKFYSMGWLPKHQIAARDQAVAERQGQGTEASKPTEYEVWLGSKSTALFALDGPVSDLVNIVCVTVRFVPFRQERFPNPIDTEQLAAFIQKIQEPSAEQAKSDPWLEFYKEKMQAFRKDSIPMGIPIRERPGFMMSPWASGEGAVDVRELPRGAEMKCPYTGNVFLVP